MYFTQTQNQQINQAIQQIRFEQNERKKEKVASEKKKT